MESPEEIRSHRFGAVCIRSVRFGGLELLLTSDELVGKEKVLGTREGEGFSGLSIIGDFNGTREIEVVVLCKDRKSFWLTQAFPRWFVLVVFEPIHVPYLIVSQLGDTNELAVTDSWSAPGQVS